MKLRHLLAGVGLAATAALVAPATAAFATETPAANSNNCTTVKHGDLSGVEQTGGPTTALTVDGVEVTNGTDTAEAAWKKTLTTPVALRNVQAMTYRAYKYDSGEASAYSAPTFEVFLSLPGDKKAKLMFEPYWQNEGSGLLKPPTGRWMTWNAKQGKWWTASSDVLGMTSEPGGGEHNKRWSEIATLNPAASVTGFGWGVYNKGTHATVNDVKFSGGSACQTNNWSTNNPAPQPSTSPAPGNGGGAPAPQPSASKSGTPQASLPVTGTNNTTPIVGTAIGLLFIGGVAVYAVRRRQRFTA